MSTTWQWAKANPDEAARQIRELERENAELRAHAERVGHANDRLVVENAALRADKERLDFLSTLTGSGCACLHLDQKGSNDDWFLTRKQIDRRMATEPKQ